MPLEIEITEPKNTAQAAIIWLHGLGASADDFMGVVPMMHKVNPQVRFIFPNAPNQPVTINHGVVMPSWYDINALDLNVQQDEVGINNMMLEIRELINQQIQQGILAKNIYLVGFSQGGALALHTALRAPMTLGGVAGLSTYLPLHSKLQTEQAKENKQIEIFLAHGIFDPVVPMLLAERSKACLEACAYNVDWHIYPIAHMVTPQMIVDLEAWLLDQMKKC